MNEDEKEEYIFSQKDNNNLKSASKKAKEKKIFTRNKSMFQQTNNQKDYQKLTQTYK